MNALRRAKSLCDVLVVGVCSDAEVTYYKNKPLMNVHERAKIPRACKWVDEVYTDDVAYYPTIENLDKYDCQYMGHGDDLIPVNGKVMYEEIRNAGRLKVFKRTEGVSTTDIMGKMFGALRTKIYKKLSMGDNTDKNLSFVSNQIDMALKESSQDTKSNFKLLNSTKRLSQFSNKRQPTQNDKVVYTAGSFDVLNCGHIEFLENTKKLGTYLIVGIYDDKLVSQVKGEEYPILDLNERVLSVLALRCVDEVIIGAPWGITKEICKTLKCECVAEGHVTTDQITAKSLPDPNEYPKSQGLYTVITPETNFTLNTILDRLRDSYEPYLNVYQKKVVRQEDYYNTQLDDAINHTSDVKATDD